MIGNRHNYLRYIFIVIFILVIIYDIYFKPWSWFLSKFKFGFVHILGFLNRLVPIPVSIPRITDPTDIWPWNPNAERPEHCGCGRECIRTNKIKFCS